MQLSPEAACELAGAVAGAAGIVAFAVAPPVAPLAALAVLLAGPVALRLSRDRAGRRFEVALPAALEDVAAVLRGGGTVSDGVMSLAASDSPVAADLRRVRARSELGVGLADALGRWPGERDVDGVRAAAGALAVATTMGGCAADAIDGLAGSLRDRLGAAAEARALSAQSRMSAGVVGVAPIAYLTLSTVVDPQSTGTLLTTTPGRVCLGLGLALELVGAWWMRRIVRAAP